MEVKITQIGNSLGVILPRDMLHGLQLAKGDSLFLTETADGMHLSPYDPELALQMTAAKKIMKKRRNVLRALAQ